MTHYYDEARVRWRYAVPEDKSSRMLLLTIGGTCVQGQWSGRFGEFFIAHSPMPVRDQAEEDRLHAAQQVQ